MTETSDAAPRRGLRGWIKALLFASLALNVLVLGAVATLALRGPPDRDMARSARPAPVAYYMALERDDRRVLRDAQRGAGPRDPQARQNRRDAVLRSLRADPFDPEAFAAALTADLAAEEGRIAALRQALLRQVTAMDGPERQAYAQRLETMALHDGKSHDGRKGKPEHHRQD